MNDKPQESGGTATDEAAPGANLDSLWRQFGKASSEKEFCASWLSLQCRIVSGVAKGIVLLGTDTEGSYSLAASWPAGMVDFKHLSEAAERALKDRRGMALKRHSENGSLRTSYDIAYPVQVAGRIRGVVALDIDSRPDDALQE